MNRVSAFLPRKLLVIIARYLAREILQAMLAVTLILVFIFLCNDIVRYLGYIAKGKYALGILLHVILLQIPILIGLMLPLGLYLGILLAYGHLCVDSEMTVLASCGFSERQLAKVTLSFAALVMVIAWFFSLWLQPAVTKRSEQILTEAQSGSLIQTILPGRFQTVQGGSRVYYVGELSRSRSHMHNVFMANLPNARKNTPWFVLVAHSGHEAMNPRKTAQYLVMQQGNLYQGNPGTGEFRVAHFETYGFRINDTPLSDFTGDIQAMPTALLWALSKKDLNASAELQWRLSIPVSVFILALLALPLSQVRPRKGRFSRMVPAILVYILYANAIFLGRQLIGDGRLPAWIGLWWVHTVALAVACWLLSREWPGFFRRRWAV